MPFDLLPTDRAYALSPDPGDPDCLCSRCGNPIPAKQCPILRVWPTEPGDQGYDPQVQGGREFRYCWDCCEKAGMHFGITEQDEQELDAFDPQGGDPFDPIPERKCRVCGCTQEDCQQCIIKTGEPCHWVEQDLCSACLPRAANPLNEREKANIHRQLFEWAESCIEHNAYPVLFIGIRDGDGQEAPDIKLWQGGKYSKTQLKVFLQALVDTYSDAITIMEEGQ